VAVLSVLPLRFRSPVCAHTQLPDNCPHTHTHPPNMQVATDTRLWLYSQLLDIRASLQELISVATNRAEAEADVLMPGGG
jgi:hypothetical protein